MVEKPNFDGKKPTAKHFLSAEGAAWLTQMYRDFGYTDEQMAEELGITRQTLYSWRKKHAKIDQAISTGKAAMDILVENSLLKQALSGNVQACLMWLYNRKPEKWRPFRNYEELDSGNNKGLDSYLKATERKREEDVAPLFSKEMGDEIDKEQ